MDGLECSEIKKSELEFSGRTDAEYYQKKFLQYQNIIEAHNIAAISKIAFDVMYDENRPTANIESYCKREECWI